MLAAAVALGLTIHVAGSETRAGRLRDRWDATVEVVVAGHDLEVGDVVTADDLASETRPAALVPPGSLTERPTAQLRATTHIPGGEPILESRLAEAGASSSTVPTGQVAVAVEVSGPLPTLAVGDRVDLLAGAGATSDALLPGADTGVSAVVVAPDSMVLEVGEDEPAATLTVAVPAARATDVAAALLSGPVTVVLRPA